MSSENSSLLYFNDDMQSCSIFIVHLNFSMAYILTFSDEYREVSNDVKCFGATMLMGSGKVVHVLVLLALLKL